MIKVRLEEINKKIKGNIILSDINIELFGGKIYGLKGQNGCGKTMLMRTICGLLLPDSGRVIVNGKVLHVDMDFPDSIGALIENPAFLPRYSGMDNLRLLAALEKKLNIRDVRTAMERVGLNPDDKKIYKKYSLGMKQKLGIANAIMGEPQIIILDEPINALDEDSVAKVKDVLISLRDKDRLIVIACHDKEELEFLSDEIIEMKEGRIIGRKEL